MSYCNLVQIGDEYRCTECGRRSAMQGVRACGQPEKPKLGDRTEAMLQKMGITEARWIEAKSLFGLLPAGGCNCGKRKKWLNGVSDWHRKNKEVVK